MKEIQLTQGMVAIVDDEDYEWLIQWKWHTRVSRRTFYASHQAREGVTVYMHRLILGVSNETLVDHKDRNGLHNWRDNLRQATVFQNRCNRAPNKNNKTGLKGVYWDAPSRKWKVEIQAESSRFYLGCFSDKNEAGRAYDEAARKYHGEFAYLNFPDEPHNSPSPTGVVPSFPSHSPLTVRNARPVNVPPE